MDRHRDGRNIGIDGNHNMIANDGCWGVFAKFNLDGVVQWEHRVSGGHWAKGLGSWVDTEGSSYTTGCFYGENMDFKPGDGVDYHSSSGPSDAFLIKLSPDGTWG